MATVSLCMIVKNEEDVLARCLECAKGIADEIIVVDTGSDDRTREIALEYTDKVYDFQWIEDFAAARNYSFSKAEMDYCMWLDADDVILEKDRQDWIALKQSLDPSVDVVMMKYNVAFDGQGNPIMSYYRERMLRRERDFRWQGEIHEAITPAGNVIYSETAVTHRKLKPGDPDRNLRIFEKLMAEGKTLEPRQQFYYGRELYYHKRYEDAIRVFTVFLDSGLGWAENEIEACRHLYFCNNGLNRPGEALQGLLRSFTYDAPRAEICCDLGQYFLSAENYSTAIFWYELALTRARNDKGGGFTQPDSYGYLPCIQLCVCYDRIGDSHRAEYYNEKAGAEKPGDAAYLYNKKYFESKLKQ